jgi:hypothetical protein
MSDDAAVLEVRGGAGGIAATYAAVRRLATTYDLAGDWLRDRAGTGGRVAADRDLLESALLCPHTFALAEAAVVAATTGPDGLLAESLGWELDARAVRCALAALAAADEAAHDAVEALDYAACFTLASRLGVIGPPAVPIVLGVAGNEDLVTDHPGLVEHLVNGGGGLLDGLPGGLLNGPTPTTEAAAAEVAALYGDDGSPVVQPLDVPIAGSDTRPSSLADLLAHLQQVAALSEGADSPLNGTIEVQTVPDPDGRSHIVYLPGTDDLQTLPWTQDEDVRDMGTNLQLVAGQRDTYQEGIVQAMHEAGIRPHEPVLLVGHSQGGMVAAALAAGGSGFAVTNVVTAGSPTAQVPDFPTGMHVLSLEQHGDVVPLLDGEPNPDSLQQTTVVFDAAPDGGIVAHHDHGVYVAGAAAADASTHPSIVESVASLHEHGFLGSGDTQVSSQVFQITRDPG